MKHLALLLAFTLLILSLPGIGGAQTPPQAHLPALAGVLPTITISAPVAPTCPGVDPRCVSCNAGNVCIDVRICAKGFNCVNENEFTRQRIHIR